MSPQNVKRLLLALIVLDVVFPLVIFPAPSLWIRLIHGTGAGDPLGLLHRLGAVWAAFAVWQIVAYLKWEREPGWLMVVAGIRWTEIWADWVYLAFADDATLLGTVALLGASPVNVLCGWLFYRSYLRYSRARTAPAAPSRPGLSGRQATENR